jgi:hypothetical protein
MYNHSSYCFRALPFSLLHYYYHHLVFALSPTSHLYVTPPTSSSDSETNNASPASSTLLNYPYALSMQLEYAKSCLAVTEA